MKKLLFVFISVLSMILCLSCITASAENDVTGVTEESSSSGVVVEELVGSYGALAYHRRSDGTIEITDCYSSITSVEIPEYIGGYPVTAIGNDAFYYCSNLISVTIPDTVLSIGNSAFCYCTRLASITIPDSVLSIGNSAFYNCYNLKELIIPDTVLSIGNYAFEYCDGLTIVTIGKSVTRIGKYAFYDCDGLRSITIPDSVKLIGDHAFRNCSNLSEIKISDSVTRIGYQVFDGTAYYNNVYNWNNTLLYIDNHLIAAYKSTSGPIKISKGTKTLADGVFEDCINLTEIKIPDTVVSVGWRAFEDCDSLTSIDIPYSVEYLGGRAFYDCDSLVNATIPDSVEYLGDYIFFDCDKLESVIIGNSVIRIGVSAFSGCSGLTSIILPDSIRSIEARAFEGCDDLESILIGESVTGIYESAFEGCDELTHVEIPSAVGYVGSKAFYNTGLEKIVFNGDDAVLDYNANTIDKSAVIYGYKWSPAHIYAMMFNREFVALDNDPLFHEHDYVSIVIESTCTDRGFTSYVCSCGDYYKEKETAALGHSFTDGECIRCSKLIDNSVVIGTASGRPGETVHVCFSVAEKTTVKSMSVHEVEYDSEKVTLVNGEWLAEGAIIADWNQNDEAGVITFTENVTFEGDIFVMTFLINDGVEDSTVDINCIFRITTVDENDIEKLNDIEIIPGMINIFNVIRGDVNGDDVVDSNDAIHLLYHTLIPERYTINQDGDFNGNGTVNSNDAIYLLYYVLLPERYPLI